MSTDATRAWASCDSMSDPVGALIHDGQSGPRGCANSDNQIGSPATCRPARGPSNHGAVPRMWRGIFPWPALQPAIKVSDRQIALAGDFASFLQTEGSERQRNMEQCR